MLLLIPVVFLKFVTHTYRQHMPAEAGNINNQLKIGSLSDCRIFVSTSAYGQQIDNITPSLRVQQPQIPYRGGKNAPI